MALITDEELERAAEELEGKNPEEAIRWGAEKFSDSITMASSFGAEDVVLLHMITRIKPDLEVFYLDTGFHFKETQELKEIWKLNYGINLKEYSSPESVEDFKAKFGVGIPSENPDLCCGLRKVEPLTRALEGRRAWITGLRREQAPTRRGIKKVERDRKFPHLIKINPLADWTSDRVWEYIKAHDIPYNPLHERGYPSIGCEPCTKQVRTGEDPRSGRWAGKEKTECGLHM